MKITKVTPMMVQAEEGWGYSFVRVDTDAGIYGIGESGMRWFGIAVDRAVVHLAELLIGEDPFGTERLWQRMSRSSFFPADKVYCAAMSGIDIALWDIKGKAFDMPVYKLLGGPVRDRVVCYPHNEGATIEAIVENCQRTTDQGWKFARWDFTESEEPFGLSQGERRLEPVESISIAVELMQRVREAVGPKIQLCLDVHTRLDPTHAITLCRQLEPFKPFFIEDPIRSENPASYRKLDRHVNLPIAAGEQWATKWSFREVIEEELIDYARIDLCNVGGITEAVKVAHACETHHIDLAPHNPLGPVSTAACLALCLASSNVGVLELLGVPGTMDTDLFPVQIGWEDGYAVPTDRPGLGIEMNMDVANSRGTQLQRFTPRFRRNDGAFTNW